MRTRNITVGIAMACALFLGASGCSSHAGGGGISVGIVRFAPSEPVSEAIIDSFRSEAEAKGWSVVTSNPDGSVDKAIAAMQNFAQKKVDLIITTVFPTTTMAAGIRTAQSAGIPVATISGGKADGIQLDLDAALQSGDGVAKQLVTDLGGKGDVLVLGYRSGVPCIGREKSLIAALQGTGIKTTRQEVPVPGQLEAGQNFTEAWLAQHPKGQGPLAVWGCFDDPALGAVVAAKQANRSDVFIYGHDGSPAGIKALDVGELRADAAPDVATVAHTLVEQTPTLIEHGVRAQPATLPIPYLLITTQTVKDYLAAHPGAAQPK